LGTKTTTKEHIHTCTGIYVSELILNPVTRFLTSIGKGAYFFVCVKFVPMGVVYGLMVVIFVFVEKFLVKQFYVMEIDKQDYVNLMSLLIVKN
jgi:hypothetical protein